jgi:hypothetical protein
MFGFRVRLWQGQGSANMFLHRVCKLTKRYIVSALSYENPIPDCRHNITLCKIALSLAYKTIFVYMYLSHYYDIK